MNTLTSRRNKKGFTLVELLVVVLILATLLAVALPLYLSSVADSSKKTCRANMQSIANAASYVGRYSGPDGVFEVRAGSPLTLVANGESAALQS